MYRVLRIKHTRRGATIALNEQHNRDNGFFYQSDAASRFIIRNQIFPPFMPQRDDGHVAWKRSPNNCCRKTLERKISTSETVPCLRGVCGVPPCYLRGSFSFSLSPPPTSSAGDTKHLGLKTGISAPSTI